MLNRSLPMRDVPRPGALVFGREDDECRGENALPLRTLERGGCVSLTRKPQDAVISDASRGRRGEVEPTKTPLRPPQRAPTSAASTSSVSASASARAQASSSGPAHLAHVPLCLCEPPCDVWTH